MRNTELSFCRHICECDFTSVPFEGRLLVRYALYLFLLKSDGVCLSLYSQMECLVDCQMPLDGCWYFSALGLPGLVDMEEARAGFGSTELWKVQLRGRVMN